MDVLYYSNHCQHCAKVLAFITKNNLMNHLNFICVDKRVRDTNNNQMFIVLENGKRVILPPNVHSVPSLLRIKKNYSVVMGDEIVSYLSAEVAPEHRPSVSFETEMNGEPVGAVLYGYAQNSNVQSDQYTMYSANDALAGARGSGGHYVAAMQEPPRIMTPDDTYKPDKLSSSVTIDMLENKRNKEIPPVATNPYPMGI